MVDLATSTSSSADYTVIATFALTPTYEVIVLDVHRERVPGPNQLALVRSLSARWRATKIGIESVAYQLAFVQAALRAGLPVVELKRARGDTKETRAYLAAGRYEAGMVYHPRSAPWLGDFEAELLHFPAGAHDDQVDCVSDACGLAEFASSRGSGAVGYRVGASSRGIRIDF